MEKATIIDHHHKCERVLKNVRSESGLCIACTRWSRGPVEYDRVAQAKINGRTETVVRVEVGRKQQWVVLARICKDHNDYGRPYNYEERRN